MVDADRCARLFADAAEIHAEHLARCGGRFTTFVPGDYALAHEALVSVRDEGDSFVELGSGAGVVTILADWLGFDAYGIELDEWLVSRARTLAAQHGSGARFVAGSFVPEAMRDSVAMHSADFLTETDGADAWAELGLELSDFDVVYDYHWPDESELHADMFARYGRRGAVVMRYSSEHGFEIGRS